MTTMHPPADLRCQIYTGDEGGGSLTRCQSEGNRWEKWGGCNCSEPDADVCEGDFYSWECGAHGFEGGAR